MSSPGRANEGHPIPRPHAAEPPSRVPERTTSNSPMIVRPAGRESGGAAFQGLKTLATFARPPGEQAFRVPGEEALRVDLPIGKGQTASRWEAPNHRFADGVLSRPRNLMSLSQWITLSADPTPANLRFPHERSTRTQRRASGA